MSYTYPEALNAMELIARDLFTRARPGKRCDVRVAADSVTGTASVDWSLPSAAEAYTFQYITINMPVKPATYRMSADEFDHWAAYVLHEVGHPLWTDKTTWQMAVAAGEHRLLNALEDVREEKRTIDLGLAVNATGIFSKLIASLHAKGMSKGYDVNDVQNIGWTLSYLGRAANGYDLDASLVAKGLDPKGVVASIVPWALKELATTTTTQDCWDLAKKVIKAVNDAKAKQPEPEPEMPDWMDDVLDGMDAEKRGGKGEDRGEQPKKPEPEEKAEGEEPEAEQADGGDIPESPKGGEAQAGERSNKDLPADEPEDEKPFSDKDVEEVDMTPSDKDTLTSNTGKFEAARHVIRALRRVAKDKVPETDIVGRNTNGSVELTAGDASKMGQQRQLLARALKREEEDSYDHGRPSGRLTGRDLAKVAVRDGNVFGKRHISEGYDTDVQVLVDGSGSMSGMNIQAASTLALVVAQACAQVGVGCTAHVFNDKGLHVSTKGKAKPKANKFAYMQNQILGGTPLTENMLRVVKLQKARAAGKRKILFLITDGGCNMGPSVLKAAGEYVEKVEGVEIANMHIGHQVLGVFRNEVAVNVHKVAATGLRQLTGLLEKGV